jgi:hypothetical protein
MDCKCYDLEKLKIECYKCNKYLNLNKINENDNNETILKKLKNQLLSKYEDIENIKIQIKEILDALNA